MRSWLSSVFVGGYEPPAYCSQDNWQPSLEAVNNVVLITNDTSKMALYEHLGFTTIAELESDGLRAWVLERPLA